MPDRIFEKKIRGIKKPDPADIPSIKLDLYAWLMISLFKNLQDSPNLPEYIKTGLKPLYKGR
jgi:hypothetical protein